ncbi:MULTISPECIES: carbohydrate ABC transporter permease [Paenibacillus]|uniref:Aldouronate transport system permease protein n=2 Tax=Paenibacillus TaxID=44249 RepID=A0AAP5H3G6_PAEAM|nr:MULTISPECIES: carbohydrate ABC transporter permease [Paenibacillus]KQY91193.1 ABC transporter permease [Paenibacillus sp. Root52]MCG7377763.1 carbohydrate ABC transporter permease [Paenibacillus sp. ACRSA]MDQ0171800.1 putative aldouronate transport system permease protein [Paenibacillus tundrae]MDR6725604.1 putative aldouronate transport system permease protein [Paenibacillus amylolyticus]
MRKTRGEKVFYLINYVLLSLVAISCILPLLNIVALSFSDARAVVSGQVGLWPVDFTWFSYHSLITGTPILNAFWNSVEITLIGTGLSMAVTIMAAYPLSRRHFYHRRFFTMAMVFTMIFNGGLIPTYLVVQNLGLVNSYGALWLPGLVSTYNMLIMRSYFENLPGEVDEAARIDGCGELGLLFRIVLPLSKPLLATIALFYGVGYWNSFMSVMIYINDTSKYNMTVLVQNMIMSNLNVQDFTDPTMISNLTPEGIRAAAVIVMVIPILAVYPFLQKYFVKGVMLGSIKG